MLQLLYPKDLHLELSASEAACHIELAEIEVTGRFEMKHSIEVTRYLSTQFQRKQRSLFLRANATDPARLVPLRRSRDTFSLATLSESTAEACPRPLFRYGLALDGLQVPPSRAASIRLELQSQHYFPQILPVMASSLRKVEQD
jgi:hypothetical protein